MPHYPDIVSWQYDSPRGCSQSTMGAWALEHPQNWHPWVSVETSAEIQNTKINTNYEIKSERKGKKEKHIIDVAFISTFHWNSYTTDWKPNRLLSFVKPSYFLCVNICHVVHWSLSMCRWILTHRFILPTTFKGNYSYIWDILQFCF